MAKLSDNFFSVVVVGAFNPTILTKEFLKENCGFRFEGTLKAERNPIQSSIEEENTKFWAGLDKFQVIARSYDVRRIEVLCGTVLQYLNVLAYTPISALGLNFNSTVSEIACESLDSAFYDYLKAYFLTGTAELGFASDMRFMDKDKSFLRGCELRRPLNDHLHMRININNLREHLILNLNYELQNLESNRKKIDGLMALLPEILKSKERIQSELFANFGM